MPAKPVTILESDMRATLDSGKRAPAYAKEHGQLVATWLVTREGRPTQMAVKVYTSIFSGVSRGVGEDSIRICLVDTVRGKGLRKMTWTTRTEGWPERLREKLRDVFADALKIPVCPSCDSIMQARANRTTGAGFFGCTSYPACRTTMPMTSRVESDVE